MGREPAWEVGFADFVQLVRVCPRRGGGAAVYRRAPVGSGGLQVGDARRRPDAGGGEQLALELGELRGLLDGAGRTGERDEVQALQFKRDAPPAVAGLAL